MCSIFGTSSRLGQIYFSLRKDVRFYAPLVDNLDFMGIDPVTFTRAGASTAIRRDGLVHAVAANVPRFQYSGETALGIAITAGETLQFSAQNGLDDSNTLIWFEDRVPKSTPTDANPFSSSGIWTGNLNFHVSHVLKASRILANAEIWTIQTALGDIAQSIPPPPEPPIFGVSFTPITEVPSGTKNEINLIFTLSADPDLNTLLIFYSGLAMKRVASSPGISEYTAGGTGNRTITMGLAPTSSATFFANYIVA